MSTRDIMAVPLYLTQYISIRAINAYFGTCGRVTPDYATADVIWKRIIYSKISQLSRSPRERGMNFNLNYYKFSHFSIVEIINYLRSFTVIYERNLSDGFYRATKYGIL